VLNDERNEKVKGETEKTRGREEKASRKYRKIISEVPISLYFFSVSSLLRFSVFFSKLTSLSVLLLSLPPPGQGQCTTGKKLPLEPKSNCLRVELEESRVVDMKPWDTGAICCSEVSGVLPRYKWVNDLFS
jgi:hypothetical protein